jgi:hypothetical protein
MPKVENMPTIAIHNIMTSPNVNYIRKKVYGDWVTQIKKNHSKSKLEFAVLSLSRCFTWVTK